MGPNAGYGRQDLNSKYIAGTGKQNSSSTKIKLKMILKSKLN